MNKNLLKMILEINKKMTDALAYIEIDFFTKTMTVTNNRVYVEANIKHLVQEGCYGRYMIHRNFLDAIKRMLKSPDDDSIYFEDNQIKVTNDKRFRYTLDLETTIPHINIKARMDNHTFNFERDNIAYLAIDTALEECYIDSDSFDPFVEYQDFGRYYISGKEQKDNDSGEMAIIKYVTLINPLDRDITINEPEYRALVKGIKYEPIQPNLFDVA